jgi:hypothetical protein
MPPEKIDSLADDVKPLVLEPPRQISGLTARVDELVMQNVAAGPHRRARGRARQAAEDAGQLFAAAVARSEGERRGADAGEVVGTAPIPAEDSTVVPFMSQIAVSPLEPRRAMSL